MEDSRRVLLEQEETLQAAVRVLIAVGRAQRLGWRTITVRRLMSIINNDPRAMVPDPASAPPSAFGARHRPTRKN